MKLIIGNKNYSSWSLRGWLAMKQSGLSFEELTVNIGGEEWETAKRQSGEIMPSEHSQSTMRRQSSGRRWAAGAACAGDFHQGPD